MADYLSKNQESHFKRFGYQQAAVTLTMKRDDTLWKAMLEDVFDDFLRFFFEEQAEIFDFDKGFVCLDKELEQLFPPDGEVDHPKFVDKLVKVFTKNGSEQWVLVHVEVQGYNDADFASRMFTYFYRVLDKYKKPVTCIAIFTDSQKNYRPQGFNYNFLGTTANLNYNTYKVIDQDAELLSTSNNPFAMVILTVLTALQKGKTKDEDLFGRAVALLKLLFQKQIPKNKIRALLWFLKYYVHFDNPEMNAKFDTEIDLITNKNTTMGIEQFLQQRFIEQGIEIGAEKTANEKNLSFTKELLTNTDFNLEKIADMVGVPVSFVVQVKAGLR